MFRTRTELVTKIKTPRISRTWSQQKQTKKQQQQKQKDKKIKITSWQDLSNSYLKAVNSHQFIQSNLIPGASIKKWRFQ